MGKDQNGLQENHIWVFQNFRDPLATKVTVNQNMLSLQSIVTHILGTKAQLKWRPTTCAFREVVWQHFFLDFEFLERFFLFG